MNQTLTKLLAMAKKAVKKISEKKSDKPKAAKASKASSKAKAKPEEAKEAPIVQQTQVVPTTPIDQPVQEAKPEVDQWKKDHIEKNKIKRPYFHFKGGIYRTSDGKLFANPEEFFAAGGVLDQVHGL